MCSFICQRRSNLVINYHNHIPSKIHEFPENGWKFPPLHLNYPVFQNCVKETGERKSKQSNSTALFIDVFGTEMHQVRLEITTPHTPTKIHEFPDNGSLGQVEGKERGWLTCVPRKRSLSYRTPHLLKKIACLFIDVFCAEMYQYSC